MLKQLLANKLIYTVRWDPLKQFWCKMTYVYIGVVLGSYGIASVGTLLGVE